MKILTLNTWGGRIHQPFVDFIKKHQDIDVFCFQEIYNNASDQMTSNDLSPRLNLFNELKELLSGYDGYFRPTIENIYGVAIFVKKELQVIKEGDILIHENLNYSGSGGNHSRNLQWIELVQNEKSFSIFNVHGLWNGMGKTDTEDRINQSKKIVEFIKNCTHDFVLCGDFNLRLDTKSVQMIEDIGLRNLIREYNITDTRTSLYTKEERFADYMFVTKGVEVIDFKVLPEEVSDHSALYLEIK